MRHHRAELGPTGVGVGFTRRQIPAQYRQKFVTIRAACASEGSRRGLDGYMYNNNNNAN